MNIKLSNSVNEGNSEKKEEIGRLQIKKTIFNKAIKLFIQDHYGEGIHFGNMNNNMEETLKELKLDSVMEAKVKLPSIKVNSLTVVNEKKNEFSDFDIYETFLCTLYAKEGIQSEKFTSGVRLFESKFMDIYNRRVIEEIDRKDQETRKMVKEREKKEIIFFVIIAIIAAVAIYFFT